METPKKMEEVKPVVEKIPEKLLKAINEVIQKKKSLISRFVQISFQVVNAQRQQVSVSEKLSNTEQNIGQKINYAFKKMKLGKRKEYQWRYDGKGNFIGQLAPKPKTDKK